MKDFQFSFTSLFSARFWWSNMSNPTTSDPFSPILNPQLKTSTGSFLDSFLQGVLNSPSPSLAVNRFMVDFMTRNKDPKTWQHESLSFSVLDTEKGQTFPLFTERLSGRLQVRYDQSSISYFNQHPESGTILKTIQRILANSTTDSASSDSESSVPLLNQIPASRAPTPTPSLSQRSVTDSLTLSAAKTLNFSASSQSLAEDQVVGAYYIEDPKAKYGPKQVVQETALRLSLFALAILLYVAHMEAPLYSLFENQCYWFATIIFRAALAIQSQADDNDGIDDNGDGADDNGDSADDNGDGVDDNGNGAGDKFFLPLNEHLPDKAGQWTWMKISEVEDKVLAVVLDNFWKEYERRISEVVQLISSP